MSMKKRRPLALLILLTLLMTLAPVLTPEAEAAYENTAGGITSQYMQFDNAKTNGDYDIQGRTKAGAAIQTSFANNGYQTYIRYNGANYRTASSNYSVSGIVSVVRSLAFTSDGKYVEVTYTLTNNSGSNATLDLGFCADVQIGSNDAAPIVETERGLSMYSDANMQMLEEDDYQYDLILKGVPGSAQDASRVWFGGYGSRASNIFDGTAIGIAGGNDDWTGTRDGNLRYNSSTGVHSLTNRDSGISASWQGVQIDAGGTKTLKYQMGVLQQSNVTATTVDAATDGGLGSMTAYVTGGGSNYYYGYLTNDAPNYQPKMRDVPSATTETAGKWQTSNGFSVAPGKYRIFYCDGELSYGKPNGSNNGYIDVTVYNATKITYQGNGGTIEEQSTRVVYQRRGATIALSDAPERSDGYNFVGWLVGGTTTVLPAGYTYMVPETGPSNYNSLQDTVTLTAQWEKTVGITYVNGEPHPTTGFGSLPAGHTAAAGDIITLQPMIAPERWTFDGWTKNTDSPVVLYPAGMTTTISAEDVNTAAVTFTAKWTQDATITFANGDANTGVANTAPIYVYPGNTISLPAAPTGDYTSTHSFAGWKITSATGSAGEDDVYPARGAYTVPSASGAAVTFTAQWVTSGTTAAITLTKGGTDYTQASTDAGSSTGGFSYKATGKSSEQIILTANIKDADDNEITGGSAVFYDGETRIGDSSVLEGVATITLSGVAAGQHSYTVFYTGVTGTYNGVAKNQVAAVNYLSTDKERPTVDIAEEQFIANDFQKDENDGKWYKTYDGAALTIAGTIEPPNPSYVTYTGITPEVTYNGSANAPRDAGSYTVKAALNDTDDYYAAVSASYTVVILPKEIKPVVSANSKVYDGTESAILSVGWDALGSSESSQADDGKVLYGDSVIASASGSFGNGNVGTGKSFTLTDIYINGGANRDNYKLPDNPTANDNYTTNTTGANITPALVTFSVSNTSQVYDGNSKEITVVGSSSPSKEWELSADKGFNVIYKDSTGTTLGTEENGGLGKKPVAAGTYTYEITCNDPNFKLSEKWKVGDTNAYAQTGTMTITSGGVADFKINTGQLSMRSAQFYANTMHVTYGETAFTISAASATVTTGTVTYESDDQGVVTVDENGVVTIVGVGNAVITATLTADNYVTTTVQYAVEVSPAILTVTANDKTVTYGDAAPSYSYTVDGYVNSDSVNVVTGTDNYACAYAQYSNAGSYAITPSGLSATNYTITFVPGTLTVSPKAITPTITAVEKVYDGTTKAEFIVSFENNQLVNNDQVYAQAVGAFDNAAVHKNGDAVNAQTVTVSSCTLVGATNYVLVDRSSGANWTINGARITPAIITFVAANTSHTYDGNAKDIVVTAVGTPAKMWTEDSEGYSVGFGQEGYTVHEPKDMGSYNYTITCLDNNYATAYSGTTATMTATGTMSIAANALTDFRFDQTQLVNNAKTVTYGDEDFTITASSNTAATANSGGAITYESSNENVATVNPLTGEVDVLIAGTTVITATIRHSNGNYAEASASYVLTVNKKDITVTANKPDAVTYGEALAPNGVTYGTFVNNEMSSVLTGTVAYSSPYTVGDSTGTYTITPYGLSSDNYNIIYASNTFSVVKREISPSVTAEGKVYDGKTDVALSVSFAAAEESGTTGVLAKDTVQGVAVGTFTSADAADSQSVSVTSLSITLGSENYKLPESFDPTAISGVTAQITPAPVTYIVNGTTHTYDGSAKEITVVPIATPALGTGYSVTYTADGTTGSTASLNGDSKPLTMGSYSYSVTTTDSNYSGSANGSLTISASAQPVFSFTSPIVTATYGGSPTLIAGTTGSYSGMQTISYTSSDTAIASIDQSSGAVTIHKAGNVTITAISEIPSYVDSTATCALVISKASLTVTAGAQTKVYGEVNPSSTASVTYSGWKNPDTSENAFNGKVNDAALAYTYSCETGTGIGKYMVTPSGLTSDCYDFNYVPGEVVITPRPVFVTVTAADKLYDTTNNVALTATAGKVYTDNGTINGTIMTSGGTEVDASGVVTGDIVTAAATGNFADAASGEDKSVTITNTSLTVGGANYHITGFTANTTATITEMPVSFTALYVPSQYDADIGLTVIRDPNIAPNLYTVEYYKADPTNEIGTDGWNTWKNANSASDAGKAPTFPGTYWYRIYANSGSGYVGAIIGSYAIDKLTQQGTVTDPYISLSVGSTDRNPIRHTEPTASYLEDHPAAFVYESSNPGIATIASDGTITGISIGSVTITVTCSIEGYYDKSWQYTVTVTSANISTTITDCLRVYNGSPQIPTIVITYNGSGGTVVLTQGTEDEVIHGEKDYAVFVRDSRAVGEDDPGFSYYSEGATEVGSYYSFIRMGSNFSSEGYGDAKVQVGQFYVIPAAPTGTTPDKDVVVDYGAETVSFDISSIALALTDGDLETFRDNASGSTAYHNELSDRPVPSSFAPTTATPGQGYSAWELAGVNASGKEGAVYNFTLPQRPDAPTVTPVCTPGVSSINITNLSDYSSYTAGVEFSADQQHWFDEVITGLTGGTEYTVYMRVKAGDSSFASLSASSGVSCTPTAKPSGGGSAPAEPDNKVPVIIDDKPINIGDLTTVGGGGGGGGGGAPVDTTAEEIQTTVVTVDNNEFNKQLASAAQGSSVIVPIPEVSGSQAAKAVLTAQMVDSAASKEMNIEVPFAGVSYDMPAAALNLTSLSDELDAGGNLSRIEVEITITKLSESSASFVEEAAQEGGYTLLLPPVEFTVTAKYGNRATTVDGFSRYVSRLVEIPADIDPAKVTTAIVVDKDGLEYHVPTEVFAAEDGKWYARIHSLTNSVYALIWNEASFTDTAGMWYEAIVTEMASRMIVSGYEDGSFRGDNAITRAEFATIVVKALGLPQKGAVSFDDVLSSDWFYGYVAQALDYGIVSGRGDGTFDPGANITREEAMIMVQRAAMVAQYSAAAGGALSIPFSYTDLYQVSAWAAEAVAYNLTNNLIKGAEGKVRPQDDITRAETATVILRLLQNAGLVEVRTQV